MRRRLTLVVPLFFLILSALWLGPTTPANAGGVALAVADVTTFDAAVPKIVEVPVRLSEPAAVDVTITWTISGGSAVAWVDYLPMEPSTWTTTIRAGRMSGFLGVKVWATAGGEPVKTIDVTVTSATGGIDLEDPTGTITLVSPGASPTSGSIALGDVTVLESDVATPGVLVRVPVVYFDNSPLPSDGLVTITYTVNAGTATAGSDFRSESGPKQMSFSTRSGGGSIGVTVFGDAVDEPTESLTVQIVSVSDPNNATTLVKSTGTVTIANDDGPSGQAWAFGYNGRGQLGIGSTSDSFSPTQIGTSADWKTVAAGETHSLAIRSDGSLWAWGDNVEGELGLGYRSSTPVTTPTRVGTGVDWVAVSAGRNFSVGLRANGTVWAWGDNSYGQLGLGNFTDQTTPTQVGTVTTWSQISAGRDHALALRSDGTLWSWGGNSFGQLGIGNTTNQTSPTQVGSSTNWWRISAGGLHSVALDNDNLLWSWGNNLSGQLGLGDTAQRNAPVQVGTETWTEVAAGGFHVVARRSDGTLWAWGRNNFSQLGLGDTTNRTSPTLVSSDTDWTLPIVGDFHSLALRSDGSLWAWGGGGPIGFGDTTNRSTPTQVGTATNWSSGDGGAGHTLMLRTP
jgi:alpha-tubulin suppressor-like RCC1 family protein